MRYIPSSFQLSGNAITLNDVGDYYDKSRQAIEQYYDPSVVNPLLVGLSPKAIKAMRDKLLRELSIECGMMLMSAVEAALRTDFVLRCRKSRKEQIDRDFKYQNAGANSTAFTSLLMEVTSAMAVIDARLQKI